MIVSPAPFNDLTGALIVLPITTGGGSLSRWTARAPEPLA